MSHGYPAAAAAVQLCGVAVAVAVLLGIWHRHMAGRGVRVGAATTCACNRTGPDGAGWDGKRARGRDSWRLQHIVPRRRPRGGRGGEALLLPQARAAHVYPASGHDHNWVQANFVEANRLSRKFAPPPRPTVRAHTTALPIHSPPAGPWFGTRGPPRYVAPPRVPRDLRAWAATSGVPSMKPLAPSVRYDIDNPRAKPLLDSVAFPGDLKGMSVAQLRQLSQELRWDLLERVSKTGGHLGSNLGVVELTVALHYVFNAPDDKIIWDVSHQCYPHKMLTGRRQRMDGLRRKDGISGFCKRDESPYDAFGAGHSSTSISAAQGMSVAMKMQRPTSRPNCIAIIGDGALTGGMAYEAMNSSGFLESRVMVILNDNGEVSLPTGTPSAGGTTPASQLSTGFAELLVSPQFQDLRNAAKNISSFFPEDVQSINRRIDEYARGVVTGGTLFEELGFYYVGPVDGHNLDSLIPILEKLRDSPSNKPVLLHIKTEKGKGYLPAERASDKMHGVARFDIATGVQEKTKDGPPSLTSVFANTLISIAEEDPKVVAITAAMPGGTGASIFARRFPKRTYDVGIAEQHAVTFAAGMAAEGLKPFCAVYSTFLQRGYDQVIHDVALQELPVRFILDRAGLVGNDGATHHGSFDLAYLGCIPSLVIMAPSDEVELGKMIRTAHGIDHLPSVVRYPRGTALGNTVLHDLFDYEPGEQPTAVEIGKGRYVRKDRADVNRGSTRARRRVAILSIGSRLQDSVMAARMLEEEFPDLSVTVADARFMKPLDEALVRQLATDNSALVTVEEGSVGGFGSHVLEFMSDAGLLDAGGTKVRSMTIPDEWIEFGTQKEQYEQAGLQAANIVDKVRGLMLP